MITEGDPGGIGPELIIKILQNLSALEQKSYLCPLRDSIRAGSCKVTVFSCKSVLEYLIKKYDLSIKIDQSYIFCKNQPEIRFFLPDLELDNIFRTPPFGLINKNSGKVSWKYIQETLNWGKNYLLESKNFCVFNLPVCKQSIQQINKNFIGHTEEYANSFGVKSYAMTFLSSTFSLVLMTTHIPLCEVASKITEATIKNAFNHAFSLQKITKDALPLLILGLNPHAGEGGMLGMEDQLIEKIRQEVASRAVGPVSPDTAFLKVTEGKHKTVIACYHDQGLIPMKLLNRFESCNYTIGLPFVRISVDHGTAFDIAGTMQCDERATLFALAKTYQMSSDFSIFSNN